MATLNVGIIKKGGEYRKIDIHAHPVGEFFLVHQDLIFEEFGERWTLHHIATHTAVAKWISTFEQAQCLAEELVNTEGTDWGLHSPFIDSTAYTRTCAVLCKYRCSAAEKERYLNSYK